MKKFKTNELLSRSEMKKINGSGYGCSTADCWDSGGFSSCNFDFVRGACYCGTPRTGSTLC